MSRLWVSGALSSIALRECPSQCLFPARRSQLSNLWANTRSPTRHARVATFAAGHQPPSECLLVSPADLPSSPKMSSAPSRQAASSTSES